MICLCTNVLFRPPPPIQDTYSMFGIQINNDDAIIQTLESQVKDTYYYILQYSLSEVLYHIPIEE